MCPYCNDTVALIPILPPVNHYDDQSYFIAKCPNEQRSYCKPIFAVYEALNNRINDVYPFPNFDGSAMDESIPANIRADYAEGGRCSVVKAYKGAVAMFRRVVEAVAC